MSLNRLDTLLFFFINKELHLAALDPAMVFVSERPYIVVLPILALIVVKEKWSAGQPIIVALAALALSDLASDALKELIRRPRPCDVLDGVRLLVACPDSFSMPSGHAAGVFAVTMPFYFYGKHGFKHALTVVAVLAALSRPYVGVHYPSDYF